MNCLRRKKSAAVADATEVAAAADKRSDQPLDSGSIVDSDSGSPSGKWPNKTRQAFVLFRLLLALPSPIFLLFTGIQYSRRDQFAGWTGSFTELDAGTTLCIQVWFASTPALGLSLLLAQISDTGDALTTSVWRWPRALEAALYLFSVSAYCLLYYRDRWYVYISGWCIANFSFLVLLYFLKIVVRAVKRHYRNREEEYKSFVLSQAARVGIITLIMACVTTYALTAMLRVPIEGTLLNVFVELSLDGIACADQAAFVSAFEASPANSSCPALPNCGYATYEDLCQAVQYAPMVRALTDDTFDVNLFILASVSYTHLTLPTIYSV